jgi:hypothetical protein
MIGFAACGLRRTKPSGGSSSARSKRTSPAVVIAARLGDRSGQPVGAAMAAQQRHDDAAVLGDRDHRRLRALVREMRSQQPDHDAHGAQRKDRPPGPIEVAQA